MNWEGILLFISQPLTVSLSLQGFADCDGVLRLCYRSLLSPNHCSNPVSSLIDSVIHYFGVHSCFEIVCMSYFMHIVWMGSLLHLSLQGPGYVSLLVSESAEMIYDGTHTPEVILGAWCITMIEADNAPTDSMLCPF